MLIFFMVNEWSHSKTSVERQRESDFVTIVGLKANF